MRAGEQRAQREFDAVFESAGRAALAVELAAGPAMSAVGRRAAVRAAGEVRK